MNIIEEIFSRHNGHSAALVEGGLSVTFSELRQRMNAASAALRASNQWPGGLPRVALSIPNGVVHIVWSLAVLRAGGVLVPVPGELAWPERIQLVKTTGAHAVLAAGGQPWRDAEGESVATSEGDSVTLHPLWPTPSSVPEEELNELQPALIRFSSGTTGRSKGVVLSHQTLLDRVRACNRGLAVDQQDRILWILPMAHHFAVSIILYLLHGATTILAKSHLGADLMRELRDAWATVLYAAPYHYGLLTTCPEAEAVPSLRLAVSTAAPLPLATAENFRRIFHLPLMQGLGIIEAGLPLLNLRHAEDRPLSVGSTQPGFDVRIDAPDEEGIGEVLLRGPGMFDAYLHPWQPRESVLDQGWLRTGDLGRMDADGCITLAGRLKSVINVAGLKCFPEEIESVLNEHPGVRESRVFALSHPDTGSAPAAEIVPNDAGAPPKPVQLISHCRERLAAYKIPMKFQIVPTIARTASGKVQR